jgi:hypothetical protein
MLTVILIPSEANEQETIDSFEKILFCEIKRLEYQQSFNVLVESKWKMYMYVGEFLDKDLQQALPEFLEKGGDFDAYEIYKSTPNGFSISPRLFKGNIRMQDESLMPVDADVKITAILDGFILER